MFVHCSGQDERAWTHGPDRDRVVRPEAVRAMAPRLYAWRSAPESCQVCMSASAMCVRSAVPMCLRCRDERTASREALVSVQGRVAGALRAEREESAGLSGYSIVFNSLSVDLGGFREVILPEAVTRTITQSTDLLALWNHDSNRPLGRISSGNLRVQADRHGLYSQIMPPSWASDHVESVQRGDVKGQSFAFRAIEDDWQIEKDMPVRYVMDMHVSEVSIVTFPAYPSTTAHVGTGKSARSIDWLEKVHRTKIA